jgi:hypothetical protein
MFLFSLTEVVVVDVLSDWIEVKDLVCLDSALCNSISRNNFLLDLFKKEYFAIRINSVSTEVLKLVSRRKLKL